MGGPKAGWVAGVQRWGGREIALPGFAASRKRGVAGCPRRRGYVENGLPFETRGKAFPP